MVKCIFKRDTIFKDNSEGVPVAEGTFNPSQQQTSYTKFSELLKYENPLGNIKHNFKIQKGTVSNRQLIQKIVSI